MIQTGSCQCGKVRYENTKAPVAVYVCHCRECQKQSASAFGITIEVLKSGFKLLGGDPKYWSRKLDTKRSLRCAFCQDCGSRLWHEYQGCESDTLSIKGGSLDVVPDLSSAVHIWVKHKMPGVVIPRGIRIYMEEPRILDLVGFEKVL